MGTKGSGNPDHMPIFFHQRFLGVQVVHILRPVFNGRIPEGSPFLYKEFYGTGMEIGHIVTGCRAALNEMAGRPFFHDDQGMFKLPCSRRIQPEITLERHFHMNTLRYIDEGTAGPYGIVKGRKFMVIRSDELSEIRFDQFRVFLDCRLEIHVNNALFFQFLLDIVVYHFRIVLGTYTGQGLLLRFRNTKTVEGFPDIFRKILPPGLHVRLRTDVSIDMFHIELRNIRRPGWNIQFIINF